MVSEGEEERSERSVKRKNASKLRRRKSLSVDPILSTPKENWDKSSRRISCSMEPLRNKQSEQSGRSRRTSRSAEEHSKRVAKQYVISKNEDRPLEAIVKKRRKRGRRRSRRRSDSREPRMHKCSMLCNKCPDSVTDRDLTRAAAADREKRERITIAKMIENHGMNELMFLTAMKRQKSYSATRGMALYLQCFCVIGCGVMAVFAQNVFNTRGNLNFYLCEMTFELFLLFVALCNVIAPSNISRFVNVVIFVLAVGVNFSHLLIVARTEGLFWKCMEGSTVLQHCFLFSIPSHYHTSYAAGFLMFLHVAIALLSVAVTIFYDNSLDWHIDGTPGAPQWITTEPLHRHQRLEEARRAVKKKRDLIEKLSQSDLQISDFPPGTTITREQSEHSVKTTTYDRLGRANVGPEHITMSRSYTLKTPGREPVTSKRRWMIQKPSSGSSVVPAKDVKTTPLPPKAMSNKVKPASAVQTEKPKETRRQLREKPEPFEKPPEVEDQPPQPIGKPINIEDYPSIKSKQTAPQGKPVEVPSDMKPLESRNVEDSVSQKGQAQPVGKPVEVPSDMRPLEKRYIAGKEEEEELGNVSALRITRMPALISPLAYLANKEKDSMEKQSDYMY